MRAKSDQFPHGVQPRLNVRFVSKMFTQWSGVVIELMLRASIDPLPHGVQPRSNVRSVSGNFTQWSDCDWVDPNSFN